MTISFASMLAWKININMRAVKIVYNNVNKTKLGSNFTLHLIQYSYCMLHPYVIFDIFLYSKSLEEAENDITEHMCSNVVCIV